MSEGKQILMFTEGSSGSLVARAMQAHVFIYSIPDCFKKPKINIYAYYAAHFEFNVLVMSQKPTHLNPSYQSTAV